AAWKVGPIERKPVKLVAAEKRSGHARMLSATTTESRGGNVVNEGSSVEKAQVILAYLREHQLIDY
ncbi:drug:proton antiporter, partial [Burkholderia ubonensis]